MAKSHNREYEFAMGFIASSESYRSQFLEKWEEILSNFIVTPSPYWASAQYRDSPYRNPPRIYKPSRNQIVLKDPETHKLVMTYASKLMSSVFGDRKHEYVIAEPVGYEDADAAMTVTRLLRYAFALPGHFRTILEAMIDMLLFGTSVIEIPWKYEEREMPVRSVSREFGVELSTEERLNVTSYDDVSMRVLDVFDFYPDPGRYRISDMSGAAKRFQMNIHGANRMVDGGLWNEDAVKAAMGGTSQKPDNVRETNVREGIDQPSDRRQYSDFKDFIGYEYWGDVPWKTDSASSRQVITVWNDHVVRVDDFPLNDPHLPFHSFIINPVQGRFYGVSPGEVVRYDQSFADAVKILLAEAIIRRVHPPIAYDSDADLDPDRIKLWKADVPIPIRGGPQAVGTLRYDADVGSGFALWQGLVQNIQGGAGAEGGIQGEEGPSRESATVGALRIQAALDRPELAAMVLEEECLPPIAQAILRRYQQFLESTEDLQLRIGQLPESIWIGTIMEEFDVKFIGSRKAMSRQMKLQSFDRLVSMASAIPAFAAQLPVQDIATYIIGELLELPEIAAKMPDSQQILMNIILSQQMGRTGAGNGVAQSGAPPATLPAQTGGGLA